MTIVIVSKILDVAKGDIDAMGAVESHMQAIPGESSKIGQHWAASHFFSVFHSDSRMFHGVSNLRSGVYKMTGIDPSLCTKAIAQN